MRDSQSLTEGAPFCLQYGSQMLPLPREAELAMKYAPEKSFQVIGVVPQDSVSHVLFMKVRLLFGMLSDADQYYWINA